MQKKLLCNVDNVWSDSRHVLFIPLFLLNPGFTCIDCDTMHNAELYHTKRNWNSPSKNSGYQTCLQTQRSQRKPQPPAYQCMKLWNQKKRRGGGAKAPDRRARNLATSYSNSIRFNSSKSLKHLLKIEDWSRWRKIANINRQKLFWQKKKKTSLVHTGIHNQKDYVHKHFFGQTLIHINHK